MASIYPQSTVLVPAESMALCSLDAAKDELGIAPDDTSKDGIIGRQIAQVSAAVHSYCGRVFVRQSYRDTFLGGASCRDALMTRQAPIALTAGTPVITVTESGIALVAAEYAVHRETGWLYRLDAYGAGQLWSAGQILVIYDAGYDVIPPDIQAATLQWLTTRYSARGRDPMLRSQTIPDVVAETYWVDTAAPAVPAAVQELLRPYCMWPI